MPQQRPHVWNPPYNNPIGDSGGGGGHNPAQQLNAYREREGYVEGGLQTGIEGDVNYRMNLGIDPSMLRYGQNAYEAGNPYATANYGVSPGRASASGRRAQQNEMSAWHLDKMLGSDSPLMQRARQKAMAQSGGRGLMNSSIAVGAAQGEMIDRAQPFALSDADAHRRAATETLQAKNQASLTNAQLATQAGIAGMQANAQRDQTLLQADIGGQQDATRHLLGMETREDQQQWQSEENQRNFSFQAAESRLNREFQWEDNRQKAIENWATTELQLMIQRGASRENALSQIASNIFGNPNLTAQEQNAAWNNAQRIIGDLQTDRPYTPRQVPWEDPGYAQRYGTQASAQDYGSARLLGMGTSPSVSRVNAQLNQRLGQAYSSASNPAAERITAELPPIV